MAVNIRQMQHKDLEDVIKISDILIGKGFLSKEYLVKSIQKSTKKGIKNSLVAVIDRKIVGYAYLYAPGNWSEFESCSPELWPSPIEKNAYYKTVGVLAGYSGKGIGTKLSEEGIKNAKRQGAENIIVHAWLNSPRSSSLKLFEKLGAKKIKMYEKRWYEDSLKQGWQCSKCGNPCYCNSMEMIIPIK